MNISAILQMAGQNVTKADGQPVTGSTLAARLSAICSPAPHSVGRGIISINGTYFQTDLFDSKSQSDLLTLIAI